MAAMLHGFGAVVTFYSFDSFNSKSFQLGSFKSLLPLPETSGSVLFVRSDASFSCHGNSRVRIGNLITNVVAIGSHEEGAVLPIQLDEHICFYAFEKDNEF